MRRYLKNYPKGHNRHRALAYLMDEASERQATDEAYKYASAIVKIFPMRIAITCSCWRKQEPSACLASSTFTCIPCSLPSKDGLPHAVPMI